MVAYNFFVNPYIDWQIYNKKPVYQIIKKNHAYNLDLSVKHKV